MLSFNFYSFKNSANTQIWFLARFIHARDLKAIFDLYEVFFKNEAFKRILTWELKHQECLQALYTLKAHLCMAPILAPSTTRGCIFTFVSVFNCTFVNAFDLFGTLCIILNFWVLISGFKGHNVRIIIENNHLFNFPNFS